MGSRPISRLVEKISMFFRHFSRFVLAIPFSRAILCGTPVFGRRALWQRNSAMRRAGAGLRSPAPRLPRGLWSAGANEEVEPESSGRLFDNGEFDPGSE